MNWWNAITTFEQYMYILASFSTLLLLVVSILPFFSASDEKKKSNVVLRCIFSVISISLWTAIVVYKQSANIPLMIGITIGVAVFVAAIVSIVAIRFSKIDIPESISPESVIGMTGNVYDTVPQKGEGKGRVVIQIGKKTSVFYAMSYEDNKIRTGRKIIVQDILDSKILLIDRA